MLNVELYLDKALRINTHAKKQSNCITKWKKTIVYKDKCAYYVDIADNVEIKNW